MAYYFTNSKTSELMVKSVCGYTIYHQTDNNVFPSMEHHQVKLKSEVTYPNVSVRALLFLIHTSDINNEITVSTVSCFTGGTRILLEMKDEVDTQMIQNDLHNLHKCADMNNTKFNTNKFELLRYGKEQEIKTATSYKSYDSNIDGKEQVREGRQNYSTL